METYLIQNPQVGALTNQNTSLGTRLQIQTNFGRQRKSVTLVDLQTFLRKYGSKKKAIQKYMKGIIIIKGK